MSSLSNLEIEKKRHKVLTKDERQAICLALMKERNSKGKPKRGSILNVCNHFSVGRHTVWRIWKEAKEQIENNRPIELNTRYAGATGPKRIQVDLNLVTTVPLHRRTTIRTMATELNMSKFTFHRRVKEGVFRRHSNSIKPYLTNQNKKDRLRFCLCMVEKNSFMHNPMFIDMFDFVHIDEKWFYLTKGSEKYYLLPDEAEPMRSCKSKRFITKVMFLAAVGRPRNDSASGIEFSGKIGIFPFVYQEPAKRKSKNRVAGTIETKAIVSVTKEVVKACLIEKVLPAIKEKWPHTSPGRTIYIQQDNAKPHIKADDFDFQEAARRTGLNVQLVCQPPNSPDMNVLDLGFFRAIQSLQHQQSLKNIDELVRAVEKAFDEFPSTRLNHVFVTLQLCMIEVMKLNGCNGYKIPHVNKSRLEQEGHLPTQVLVASEIIEAVQAHLQE